jgi:circadian clock protein KaiC
MPETTDQLRSSTGMRGLDFILHGGLPENKIHLVYGGPGTGKTTLSLQFLMAGAREKQRCLYVTLLQTRAELNDVLRSHGWSLDGVEVLQLPEEVREASLEGQTFFSPADVELNEAVEAIIQTVGRLRPQRMVLDSVSELSALVDSSYQLRHNLLRLKHALDDLGCTSIVIAGDVGEEETRSLQTIVHGVVRLERKTPPYGPLQRRISVVKMRGMDFYGGYHDLKILTGGISIYPRLRVGVLDSVKTGRAVVESGNGELDALLGGGLEEGTSCLIIGTTGAGKSTIASLYVQSAAERGQHSAVFCFDERKEIFIRRAAGLGMTVPRFIEKGTVDLRQVDVGEISIGEFGQLIRHAVEREKARIVVIDSLTGYFQAVWGEGNPMSQLHELLGYLCGRGVLTILTLTTHGLFGEPASSIDASYITDTVILMRHFEARGRVRRCISVFKKRHGAHEDTIREVRIGAAGIHIGEPLMQFTGLLSGIPRFEGGVEKLYTGGDGNGKDV